MRAARRSARRRVRGPGLMAGLTVALAAAGIAAFLVIGLVPGRGSGAGHVKVASAASTHVTAPRGAGSPAPAPDTATAAARSPAAGGSRAVPAVAPLAGQIRPGVTYRGIATSYAAGDGDGACMFGLASDLMVAAMNYTDYQTARACGAYILVRAAGGTPITVKITSECPACAPGQIDLSTQAFARLAPLSAGRIPITWSLLSPAMAGAIAIRYKTGSSRWWCGLQVIGHRNPVALLEVATTSGWHQLPRASYNYFISADGTGCGTAIRITDIYAQQLTITGIALAPDLIQPTPVQFARH